jgi:hypothetical protein
MEIEIILTFHVSKSEGLGTLFLTLHYLCNVRNNVPIKINGLEG